MAPLPSVQGSTVRPPQFRKGLASHRWALAHALPWRRARACGAACARAHPLVSDGAQVADSVGEESDAYEFLTQTFTVYEEDISDSRSQLAAVTLAAGAAC